MTEDADEGCRRTVRIRRRGKENEENKEEDEEGDVELCELKPTIATTTKNHLLLKPHIIIALSC